MGNMSCVDGHNYGLWRKENGKGCRTCKECLHIESLPWDLDMEKQHVLQEKASDFFNKFKMIDSNNSYIVAYLCILLQDHYNYLNDNDKNVLFNIVLELRKNNFYNSIDNTFINGIYSSLENNKLEELDNIYSYYRANIDNSILEEVPINGYHR